MESSSGQTTYYTETEKGGLRNCSLYQSRFTRIVQSQSVVLLGRLNEEGVSYNSV